jgi:hypothetical protein
MVFNKQGGAFTIDGPETVLTGTNLSDGYSCPVGSFFRDAGRIKKFFINEQGDYAAEELCSGIIGDRIAWEEFNGEVYFSDGKVSRKIINGEVMPWGVQVPLDVPLLSGSSVLGSGQVMACYSYILDDGSESGTSPVAISETGRTVSNIKRSDDPRVAAVKVYMTGPNNSTFYHAATILNGQPSVEVTTDYRNGEEAVTRGKYPPPPCNLIRQYAGRMYMAVDNLIYFTDAHSLNLVSIGESVIDTPVVNIWQFVGRVTLLEAVSDGLYVGCQNGTYWIAGSDPYNARQVLVDSSIPEIGAVRKVQTGEVIWKSDAGYLKGSPGGRVERMNYDNVAMDVSSVGETAMGSLDINGTEVVIGTPVSPKPSQLRGQGWNPDFINK